MTRPTQPGVQWEHGLNQCAEPVYALDAARRIAFANTACADWLGVTNHDLLGLECRYHSDPQVSGLPALAAALCPPPEVFSGRRLAGSVYRLASEHLTRHRSAPPTQHAAQFIPLTTATGRVLSVWIFVDPQPTPEPDAAAGTNGHEQLQQARAQLAQFYEAGRLLGESPAMKKVRNQVTLAAQSSGSVLLVGPPGIGRRFTARTIHYAGQHTMVSPLISLDCARLPGDQLRTTLRTHTQTGPSRRPNGNLTLLLEEIDQLPLADQSELLNLLTASPVPLRLLSTAQQHLEALAAEGNFRLELAHFLSTLTIQLPPLSDRRGDIPLLAQMFLEQANAGGAKQLSGFSSEALDLLLQYTWPGQMSELSAAVSHAHAQAASPMIQAAELPPVLRHAQEALLHPLPQQEVIDLESFLSKIEIELIERALNQSQGNKTKAARLLGMNRPRLYRRLKELGLLVEEQPDFTEEP